MSLKFTATLAGYSVTTRSDSYYFTVYKGADDVGTICRPMHYDRHWSAWDRDGHFLGNSIGPRTALRLFFNTHHTRDQP